jgi:hypothetical protein
VVEQTRTSAWQERKLPSRRYRQWKIVSISRAFLTMRYYRGFRRAVFLRSTVLLIYRRKILQYDIKTFLRCTIPVRPILSRLNLLVVHMVILQVKLFS